MTLTRLMAGVALIALMGQPALAQTESTTGQPQQEQIQAGEQMQAGEQQQMAQEDIEFATKAAEGGLMEVQLGELAQQQAATQEVQQFGQRMVEDHGQANEQLQEIAQQKGIELPEQLSDEAQQLYDELQQKSAEEFDQAYMDEMVSDHQNDIEAFEQYAQSGQDPDLVAFAEQTLPTLREHLELAQQTQEQVSVAAIQDQQRAATQQEQAATDQAQPGPQPAQQVRADEVIGSTVVNANGEEVAEIEDIVIDRDQVQYAILSVGGFFGLGAKNVAVPMDQLQLGEDETYLLSAETEEQLEQLPAYEEGQHPSLREQQQGQLQQ